MGSNGYHPESVPQCNSCGVFIRNDRQFSVDMHEAIVTIDGREKSIIVETWVCEECEGMEGIVRFYARIVDEQLLISPNKDSFGTDEAFEPPLWLEEKLFLALNSGDTCFEIRKLESKL